jgi:tetratricopeptide (TPR) repeat protein
VADTSRIEELRRRVQRDPASIAFAQLAEEYRRAGRYKEAIATCEDGLLHHPGYLSARVTLGRALIETDQLDAAQLELRQVLRAAPENLAALRGLAEIHHRRGELHEALAHYRTALEFARHDPELEHLVEQIQLELEPRSSAPVVVDGLSFDEVKNAFLNLSLPGSQGEGGGRADVDGGVEAFSTEAPASQAADRGASEHLVVPDDFPGATDVPAPESEPAEDDGGAQEAFTLQMPETIEDSLIPEEPEPVHAPSVVDDQPLLSAAVAPAVSADDLAELAASVAAGSGAQVDALERWLEVILAERQRRT